MRVSKGNDMSKYVEFEEDKIVVVHDVDDTYFEYINSCYGDCYRCGKFGGIECVINESCEFDWLELGCWNVDEILEGKRG